MKKNKKFSVELQIKKKEKFKFKNTLTPKRKKLKNSKVCSMMFNLF